jgi:Flp pilus assembly pilin Flp
VIRRNITAPIARLADESGQALAEYSLLFAFIVAVCIVAVTALGLAIATGLGGILPAF